MNFISGLLPIVQVILSVLLIILILIQRSDEGVGSAFGGGSEDGGHFSRRGAEKTLFQSTVVIAVLFAISSILALFLL